MGGAASRHQDRPQPASAQDQHGRRPWWQIRPLYRARGTGRSLWLHPRDDGPGSTDRHQRYISPASTGIILPRIPAAAEPMSLVIRTTIELAALTTILLLVLATPLAWWLA